jgi:hypothetical protein
MVLMELLMLFQVTIPMYLLLEFQTNLLLRGGVLLAL